MAFSWGSCTQTSDESERVGQPAFGEAKEQKEQNHLESFPSSTLRYPFAGGGSHLEHTRELIEREKKND